MKKTRVIFSLFVVLQSVFPLWSGEIEIVKDGKAKAVIVQGRLNKCCTLAVEVLRRCIEKGTGVRIAKMRECMKLWKNVPLGRSPEFLKSFMELQAMRKAFDSRFVSSSHHQNYNEVTRKARMVPFLPSGKWPTENDYISGEWLKSLDTIKHYAHSE